MKNRRWLIWSNEHCGWWSLCDFGYTTQIERAQRYTEAEARERCRPEGAAMYENVLNEVAVLAPEE